MANIIIDELNNDMELNEKEMASVRGGVMPRVVIRNGKRVLVTCTDGPLSKLLLIFKLN